MDTQIDLPLPRKLIPEAQAAVRGVLATLKQKHQASADTEYKQDLAFEISGLKAVAATLV